MTTGCDLPDEAEQIEAHRPPLDPECPPLHPQHPPRLSICFAVMGLIWLLLLGVSSLFERVDLGSAIAGSWLLMAGTSVAAAVVGALCWVFRGWLMRVLTSLPFSVAQITFLLVLTALGTVVLQQAPPEAYVERYGEAMAWLLVSLGMDDLFHTPWLAGLLAVMAFSLVLTVIKRRAWRPTMWGHMLSHLGFVTILLGGWIGSTFGFKGTIDLHEGQVAHEVRLQGTSDETRPLGFSLKLERFDLEHYVPEAKFYVYERDGTTYRAVRAFELDEARVTRQIGSTGATFRLIEAYPDFVLVPEIRAVAPGTGRPVLQVDFRQGDWAARAALQAGVTGKDAAPLSTNGPQLRFVWAAPDEADLAKLVEGSPQQHIISLPSAHGADPEEVVASIGTGHLLPKGGYEVQVQEYLPDFSYNTQTKTAITRSREPRNPAVRVLVKDLKTLEEKQYWLYANMPGFGHGEGETGPRLVYRHQAAQAPLAQELLVIGESRQLWRLEHGRVLERLPLEQWPRVCADLPVSGMQVHDAAEIEMVPGTMSEAWENPVVDIELEDGGEAREIRLATGHGRPLAMADGKTFLAFEMRGEEPKVFRSHLTVLEDGKAVAEKSIVVNDPLSYKGFMFYQSNFRREDPTYSGIMVVRDPGLIVAFVGMVMMSIGVFFVYYIRPRLLRREADGH